MKPNVYGSYTRDLDEWRIEVISTPTTIYRDLQGSRRFSREGMGETQLALPEPAMLAGIGRRDLLATR